MSSFPKPHIMAETLEQYSLKLESYKTKFNPIFSQVSHDLMKKVDYLRKRIELYAHFDRDHQLKHLIESKKAKAFIDEVHTEMQVLHSQFKELERMIRLGENLS